MWFLDLLGLLYHSTVDRNGILEVQYYQPPTQLINQNIIMYSLFAYVSEQINLYEHL